MFKRQTRTDDDGLRRFWLVTASLILVVIPFWTLTLDVMFDGPLASTDHRIATRMNHAALESAGLRSAAKVVTWFGSTPALLVVALGACAYFVARDGTWRVAAFLAGTDLFGVLLNNLVKLAVGRDRPMFEDPVATAFGKSFPSGHAMNSAIVFGTFLAVLWWRRPRRRDRATAAVLVAALVVAIAASRVVLSVHYLTDVLAGIVLGVAVVLSSTAWFRVWRFIPKRRRAGIH